MSGMNETPKGNRTHIAVFGLRNAGKSTLVNAIRRALDAGVPIVNYGIAIAACHGIVVSPDTCMVERKAQS